MLPSVWNEVDTKNIAMQVKSWMSGQPQTEQEDPEE